MNILAQRIPAMVPQDTRGRLSQTILDVAIG